MVDNVSKESSRAGLSASDYLDGLVTNRKKIAINPGKNILYVAPQYLDFGWIEKDLLGSFRSSKKLEKALVKVYQGEKIIYQKRRAFIVPAEMETITFPYLELDQNQDIMIEIEEV